MRPDGEQASCLFMKIQSFPDIFSICPVQIIHELRRVNKHFRPDPGMDYLLLEAEPPQSLIADPGNLDSLFKREHPRHDTSVIHRVCILEFDICL